MREHPCLNKEALREAREFNFQCYHFQGIGRYDPDAAYARDIADLKVLGELLPESGYIHGPQPSSIDAPIYGLVTNIYSFEIDTPLKQFVASQRNLLRHGNALHEAVSEHS